MSNEPLRLGRLQAEAGRSTAGYVAHQIGDVAFRMPAMLFNGVKPGPTLVVTAGIHGGEYPCVEAAARLGRELTPDGLAGRVLIVPSANPVAFAARAIYVTPPDGKNLNRMFPGDAHGTFTERWAHWLFEHVIKQADYYIDMHGGDMVEALVPFSAFQCMGDERVDTAMERMAHAYGLPHILAKRTPDTLGGTTTATAARAGIPALLTEAGGQGVWDEESVTQLREGVLRVMADLDMIDEGPAAAPDATVHEGWTWLRSSTDGMFYPAVDVGDAIRRGQEVGYVADIFGKRLETYIAPVPGTVLFLVTSLAMNDGDPVLAIGH